MRIDGTRFEEARSDDAGQPNAEGAGFKGAGLVEMDETFCERVYEQVRKVPLRLRCASVPGTQSARAGQGYPRASREVGLCPCAACSGRGNCRATASSGMPRGTLAHGLRAFGGTAKPACAVLEAEGVAFLDDDTIWT